MLAMPMAAALTSSLQRLVLTWRDVAASTHGMAAAWTSRQRLLVHSMKAVAVRLSSLAAALMVCLWPSK